MRHEIFDSRVLALLRVFCWIEAALIFIAFLDSVI